MTYKIHKREYYENIKYLYRFGLHDAVDILDAQALKWAYNNNDTWEIEKIVDNMMNGCS